MVILSLTNDYLMVDDDLFLVLSIAVVARVLYNMQAWISYLVYHGGYVWQGRVERMSLAYY